MRLFYFTKGSFNLRTDPVEALVKKLGFIIPSSVVSMDSLLATSVRIEEALYQKLKGHYNREPLEDPDVKEIYKKEFMRLRNNLIRNRAIAKAVYITKEISPETLVYMTDRQLDPSAYVDYDNYVANRERLREDWDAKYGALFVQESTKD